MGCKAIVTVVFSGLLSGAAVAGSAAMTALDGNGDGVITADEAEADSELAQRFEELDTNNDQKLDDAEFERFEKEMAKEGE